jgi:hypothetical protein
MDEKSTIFQGKEEHNGKQQDIWQNEGKVRGKGERLGRPCVSG